MTWPSVLANLLYTNSFSSLWQEAVLQLNGSYWPKLRSHLPTEPGRCSISLGRSPLIITFQKDGFLILEKNIPSSKTHSKLIRRLKILHGRERIYNYNLIKANALKKKKRGGGRSLPLLWGIKPFAFHSICPPSLLKQEAISNLYHHLQWNLIWLLGK